MKNEKKSADLFFTDFSFFADFGKISKKSVLFFADLILFLKISKKVLKISKNCVCYLSEKNQRKISTKSGKNQ